MTGEEKEKERTSGKTPKKWHVSFQSVCKIFNLSLINISPNVSYFGNIR